MAGAYAVALGARLRDVRRREGLSLREVELRSDGQWKAAVVGSYERAERGLTLLRLAKLAEFYGVPVLDFLPESSVQPLSFTATPVVISVDKLASIRDRRGRPLIRYVRAIRRLRNDYNPRVLSIRVEDVRGLAAMYGLHLDDLVAQLDTWNVLEPASR